MAEQQSTPENGVSTIRDAVNRVSLDLHQIHDSPPQSDSSAVKALLDLRTSSASILSGSPVLLSLSHLADSVQDLHDSKPSKHRIVSFLTHLLRSHEVSRLAADVAAELQALIDRETLSSLTQSLAESGAASVDEAKVFDEMSFLQERLSQGFDMNLQELLLKSTIFAELERVLCNPSFSKRVREKAAILITDLVLFNKDVFIGPFLVGGSIEVLVSMGTLYSLRCISSLIKAIRSPLVDETESCGGIVKIMGYLSSDDLDICLMAVDCAMKIGYFGRKEAVEAMINGGIVKRFVELQRMEVGRELGSADERFGEINHSFNKCVARFAVQLEVGEGLRQREKRAFKQQILCKVREACVSDAESATIVAEVLWGSCP